MPELDIIEITQELGYSAKLLASSLSEPQIRKRGMIDMLGINCALNYLQSKRLKIDTRRSVYSIPSLFEEFKITDIYYGNYRIDVITLYKEKTVKIPKVHAEVDVMPDFYFVVQIGSKIKEAKMIGFIEAKSVLGCSSDSKYYYPTLDLIFDLKKFTSITKRSTPSRTLLGKHADCLGLFLKFIDNDLSNVYKSQLIQHIMNCDSCRGRFIEAMEFEKIANSIRQYPSLIKKYEHKIQPETVIMPEQPVNGFEQSLIRSNPKEIYRIENEDNTFIAQDTEPEMEPELEPEVIVEEEEQEKDQPPQKVIDTIFKELKRIEIPQLKTIIKSKHRHALLALAIMFVILISVSLISLRGASNLAKDASQLDELQDNYANEYDPSEYETLYNTDNPSHQARLIPRQRDVDDFDIQAPVPSQPTYSPSVSKIAWEVPESLLKKADYTKFLQTTGKNIKLNLQNELLLVRDVPINRLITVNIKITSGGDVQSVNMIQTSGSPAIDAAINKVVKDTLRYMKPPAHGIIAKPVDASLTIELN